MDQTHIAQIQKTVDALLDKTEAENPGSVPRRLKAAAAHWFAYGQGVPLQDARSIRRLILDDNDDLPVSDEEFVLATWEYQNQLFNRLLDNLDAGKSWRELVG